MGRDHRFAEAGHKRTDPCSISVNELHDRSIRIMIEGVHAGIADHAVLPHGIPTFPDRGRSHVHLEQPARITLFQQQIIGSLIHTRFSQNSTQKRRAHETALNLIQILLQPFLKLGNDFLSVTIDSEFQRDHISGLRINGKPAVWREELVQDGLPDLLPQSGIARLVFLFPEAARHLLHDLHGAIIVDT